MTLLRDAMDPLARRIAAALVDHGFVPGSAWHGYNLRPWSNGDLVPMRQDRDDAICYMWERNHETRIWFDDLRFEPVNPDNFEMNDQLVLSSKLKAATSVPFRNNSSEAQTAAITHTEAVGENEILAIATGFETKTTISAEVSGGIQGIAEAKASVVNETSLRASFERTTGRKIETLAGGTFTFNQPPYTAGECRLTWNEQTKQTRVRGYRLIDCKVGMGRWHRYRKYDARKARKTWRGKWERGCPAIWPSVQSLLAVMEKRGSVHDPGFEHFANRPGTVNPWHLQKLREELRQQVDFLTEPYRDATEFRTEVDSWALKHDPEVVGDGSGNHEEER